MFVFGILLKIANLEPGGGDRIREVRDQSLFKRTVNIEEICRQKQSANSSRWVASQTNSKLARNFIQKAQLKRSRLHPNKPARTIPARR